MGNVILLSFIFILASCSSVQKTKEQLNQEKIISDNVILDWDGSRDYFGYKIYHRSTVPGEAGCLKDLPSPIVVNRLNLKDVDNPQYAIDKSRLTSDCYFSISGYGAGMGESELTDEIYLKKP